MTLDQIVKMDDATFDMRCRVNEEIADNFKKIALASFAEAKHFLEKIQRDSEIGPHFGSHEDAEKKLDIIRERIHAGVVANAVGRQRTNLIATEKQYRITYKEGIARG